MGRIIILVLTIVAIACPANGQIAKWLIPPQYDAIQLANGGDLIITDSVDLKVLWSPTGRRLAICADQISDFSENRAVTIKKGSNNITGFYDGNGRFIALSECNVALSKPFFLNGHLLVLQGDFYRFVNSEGNLGNGQYTKAYPFYNGYATCSTFLNLQKRKDPYNLLLTKDNEEVVFEYEGKRFDNDDIEFISSVNDESIGIVVAKHRLYYFNGKDRSLTPIYAREGETNKKNQAKLEDDIDESFSVGTDSTSVLQARCGKKDKIRIVFDDCLMPLSISMPEGERIFIKDVVQKRPYESPLVMTQRGNKFGISWDVQEILPPQLDELIKCFGDKAFVRLTGKCGMLQIMKDELLKISINKGNPIDFRHQKYETTIRLDLPKAISAFNTRISIDPQSGCEVDMPSGEMKDTDFGNFVQYGCVLNIPKSLPDEMYGDSRNEITYPTQIIYDGLKSPVIPFKVLAWHYKYFNVDVNESETSLHQGTLTFTFNINAERIPGEPVYPTIVNMQTDSLQCELEKISETRYKCKVLALNEGTNNIVVQILEQGCPPASFPFEVTYTKPSARTRNKAAVKEDVVIKKKAKKAQVTPHLEI
jgi:hypothetical protein